MGPKGPLTTEGLSAKTIGQGEAAYPCELFARWGKTRRIKNLASNFHLEEERSERYVRTVVPDTRIRSSKPERCGSYRCAMRGSLQDRKSEGMDDSPISSRRTLKKKGIFFPTFPGCRSGRSGWCRGTGSGRSADSLPRASSYPSHTSWGLRVRV